MANETVLPRPALRGYVHLGSALAALAAFVPLLFMASSPQATASALILGASTILLFGTSATYHLVPWRDRAHRVMKRLDHAMIFVAVSGLFTPFCLQAMDTAWSVSMLALTWSLAIAGVAAKVARPDMPRWLGVAMYLVAGWLPVASAFEIAQHLPIGALLAVLVSGLIYSAGGVVYALRWPNPAPRVFGYHEMFHACTTVATAVLWVVVAVSVLPA